MSSSSRERNLFSVSLVRTIASESWVIHRPSWTQSVTYESLFSQCGDFLNHITPSVSVNSRPLLPSSSPTPSGFHPGVESDPRPNKGPSVLRIWLRPSYPFLFFLLPPHPPPFHPVRHRIIWETWHQQTYQGIGVSGYLSHIVRVVRKTSELRRNRTAG